MNQIYVQALKPGDILLEMFEVTATHIVISAGQFFSGANRNVVHAGLIARDGRRIIEAVKPTIRRVPLAHANYVVYRANFRNLALGAAECAEMLIPASRRIPYNTLGTVRSLVGEGEAKSDRDFDSLIGRIFTGGNHELFCSQFVVFVYQFVARQNGFPAAYAFGFSDEKANPAYLAKVLAKSTSFALVGLLKKGEHNKPLPQLPIGAPTLVRTSANLSAMKLQPIRKP